MPTWYSFLLKDSSSGPEFDVAANGQSLCFHVQEAARVLQFGEMKFVFLFSSGFKGNRFHYWELVFFSSFFPGDEEAQMEGSRAKGREVCVPEEKILSRNLLRYAFTERNILSYIRHPYIDARPFFRSNEVPSQTFVCCSLYCLATRVKAKNATTCRCRWLRSARRKAGLFRGWALSWPVPLAMLWGLPHNPPETLGWQGMTHVCSDASSPLWEQ